MMKRIFCFCALVLSVSGLLGQDCTGSINMGVSTPGFHPAQLPNAIVGVAYNEITTWVIPSMIDNSFTPPPGDSVPLCAEQVMQILDLPPGFTAEVWAFNSIGNSYDVMASSSDTFYIPQPSAITRACIRIKSVSPVAPDDPSDCLIPIDSNRVGIVYGHWTDLGFGCASLVAAGASDTSYFGLAVSTPPGSWTSCDSQMVNNPELYCYHQYPTICHGDSFLVGSSIYTASGNYIDLFTTANGCDSIVQTHLTESGIISTTTDYFICPGDTIEINGTNYFTSGNFQEQFIAVNGCDSTANYDVQFIDCTGIENEPGIDVHIYPNPTTHIIQVNLLSGHYKGDLEIIDLMGRKVFTQKVDLVQGNILSIDLSGLQDGIYFIRMAGYKTRLVKHG